MEVRNKTIDESKKKEEKHNDVDWKETDNVKTMEVIKSVDRSLKIRQNMC